MSADLIGLTLTEVAGRIAARDVSATEVTTAILRRIGRHDPALNAFVSVDEAAALAAAAEADRELSGAGDAPLLHGVPIAVKDNIAVRGAVTRAGSRLLASEPPAERDAPLVAALRAAGAVLVGRLNMHELAYGITTENPHTGVTRNPWDPRRSAGGSSGGAGCAVAARLCYAAIGTDTACSIRQPAAYNGVTGLRPTPGRVSTEGIVPLAWTLDAAGPLCRTARDCARLLDALAGGDAERALDGGLAGARLAVLTEAPADVHPDAAERVDAAVGILRGGGARVRRIALPDLEPSVPALLTINLAEAAAYHGAWLRERPQDYGDDVRALLEAGERIVATEYVHAQRYRRLLRERLDDVLRDADAIVTPTVPFAAPPIGATTVRLPSGRDLDMRSGVMRTNVLSPLAGLPALSLPCGFDADGLPLGLQLMGRALDEATLLRIGHAFQRLTDWHAREPCL